MKRSFLIAVLILAAGCDAVPADLEGTADRVRAERSFRVGLIASGPPLAPERATALLDGLARATGGRPALERGAAETLLARLEKGELDLVLGEFAEPSPWAAQVTITEPIARRGEAVLAAAARNGENEWISLLFREAKAATR